MSQGKSKFGAVVNTVMNTLIPPNAGNLFTNSSTISYDWCTSVSLCEPAVKWGSVKQFPKMPIGLNSKLFRTRSNKRFRAHIDVPRM
jgi:hypothetical protein